MSKSYIYEFGYITFSQTLIKGIHYSTVTLLQVYLENTLSILYVLNTFFAILLVLSTQLFQALVYKSAYLKYSLCNSRRPKQLVYYISSFF